MRQTSIFDPEPVDPAFFATPSKPHKATAAWARMLKVEPRLRDLEQRAASGETPSELSSELQELVGFASPHPGMRSLAVVDDALAVLRSAFLRGEVSTLPGRASR